MTKLKQCQKEKVYKITLGSFTLESKDYYESHDTTSINVLAVDIHSAINKAGNWILEEARKAKKDDEGVFVQEVRMLELVDLTNQ